MYGLAVFARQWSSSCGRQTFTNVLTALRELTWTLTRTLGPSEGQKNYLKTNEQLVSCKTRLSTQPLAKVWRPRKLEAQTPTALEATCDGHVPRLLRTCRSTLSQRSFAKLCGVVDGPQPQCKGGKNHKGVKHKVTIKLGPVKLSRKGVEELPCSMQDPKLNSQTVCLSQPVRLVCSLWQIQVDLLIDFASWSKCWFLPCMEHHLKQRLPKAADFLPWPQVQRTGAWPVGTRHAATLRFL